MSVNQPLPDEKIEDEDKNEELDVCGGDADASSMEGVDDVVTKPQQAPQIGFSIAQIMGFIQKTKTTEAAAAVAAAEPRPAVEPQGGGGGGGGKSDDDESDSRTEYEETETTHLWRPQPCRKYNSLMAAAAALASAQQSEVTAPPAPLTADFGASLLRHYSLFSPWKSTLLSSYTNLLSLPHLSRGTPFLPPAQPDQFHGGEYSAATAAALMSSLGGQPAKRDQSEMVNQHKASYERPYANGNPVTSGSSGHRQQSYNKVSGHQMSGGSQVERPTQDTTRMHRPAGQAGGKTNGSNTTNNGQQKTFPCTECGKIFNAHYNLTRHMPVHTGEFPWRI